MSSQDFMAHQDHRSRLVQWLADEFYNWARQLPDEKLAYLHDHFDVITSLPLDADGMSADDLKTLVIAAGEMWHSENVVSFSERQLEVLDKAAALYLAHAGETEEGQS